MIGIRRRSDGTLNFATLQAAATTSYVVTLPEASVAGNLLVLFCSIGSSPTSIQTPAGWNRHSTFAQDGSQSGTVLFWKVSAGESSVTVTSTTSAVQSADLIEVVNADTANPFEAVVGAATAGSGVTTLAVGPFSTAGEALVLGHLHDGGGDLGAGTVSSPYAEFENVAANRYMTAGRYSPVALTNETVTWTWTTARRVSALVAAIRATGATPGPNVRDRTITFFSNTTSVAPTLPAFEPGDLLVMIAGYGDHAGSNLNAFATPSGWVSRQSRQQTSGLSNSIRMDVWTRDAQSGDTAPTLSAPGAVTGHVVILAIRQAVYETSDGAAGATANAPAIGTAKRSTEVVAAVVNVNNSASTVVTYREWADNGVTYGITGFGSTLVVNEALPAPDHASSAGQFPAVDWTWSGNPLAEIAVSLVARTATGTSISGTQAAEADQALAGAPAATFPGTQGIEADQGLAGTLAIARQGTQAVEVDQALAGTPAIAGQGTQAVEDDQALAGTLAIARQGTQAVEVDQANAGTPFVEVAGSQAVEVDQANVGVLQVLVVGSQALEVDQALGRTEIGGLGAVEIDVPNAGYVVVTVFGNLATEADVALASNLLIVTGGTAVEIDEALTPSFSRCQTAGPAANRCQTAGRRLD